MTEATLPVPVLDHPHWRVLLRPSEYVPGKLVDLADCFAAVERAQVRLRGWPFPFLSRKPEQRHVGNDWVGAWSEFGGFGGHLEYWRLYQSTQFLYLGAVREKLELEWDKKIRSSIHLYLEDPPDDLSSIPGFIALKNLIYSFTEYFEFAARLCETEVYAGQVEVEIDLRKANGFVLVADPDWAPLPLYRAGSGNISFSRTLKSTDVMANARRISLEATLFVVERLGWLRPPQSPIRELQDNFLAGKM